MFKAALVSTAKTLGFTVTCRSGRADAVPARHTEVWPPRAPYAWLLPAVAETEG